MANAYFRFKQFTVYQDRCSMKVTTDAVMLGAWANVTGVRRILDVGTGTGILSLMMAQRSEAVIDALETDEPACMQASHNVAQSPWKNRIALHQESFQHFAAHTAVCFDLIIANPPYYENYLPPPDSRKLKARHAVTLTHQELLKGVRERIHEHGRLSLILPCLQAGQFIDLAGRESLHCNRMLQIRPKPGMGYNRTLLEFSLTSGRPAETDELTIRTANGHYTAEYRALTRDFYLAF